MAAHIAVVNDDTMFLDLMHDLLEMVGYDVRLHKAATASYPELKDEHPDLIILDIRMETPEAGWQLLELLTLDPATTTIPVLVCSADVIFLRAKAAHLAELGCAILEKPFDIDTLLDMVAQLLSSSNEQGD